MPKEKETFKRLNILGTGGFAQTWRANVLNPFLVAKWGTDEVAIKIPLTEEKELALINEIQLNGSLCMKLTEMESKNIVTYLGFDRYDGWIVMVMKYIPDGSLRDLIGSPGMVKRMEPDKAVTIIQGVLEGLCVIHANNIIHRDIKPENILMEDGIPKISDLGIGRILKANEMASTTTGTVFYTAPEIITKEYANYGSTYNADIWSVGVTFYEMLFGQFPFNLNVNMNLGELTSNVANDNIKLAFPDAAPVSQELKRILTKALQRNPKERYKTADDMLRDLNRLVNGDNEEIDKALNEFQQPFCDAGQIDAAETKFKELLRKYPKSSRIYLNMGEFYNKCGSYEKAIDAFQKGLEIDPESAILHWGIAMAYQKKKENKLAISSLQRALDCGLEAGLERYAKLMMSSLQNQKGGK